jgi:hypothetical protein
MYELPHTRANRSLACCLATERGIEVCARATVSRVESGVMTPVGRVDPTPILFHNGRLR